MKGKPTPKFVPGDIVRDGEVWPPQKNIGLVIVQFPDENGTCLILWSDSRALTEHHTWFLHRVLRP